MYTTLLIFFLMASTLMTSSASSWLMAWFGLEINLMTFIPLIMIHLSPSSSEASIKYFLTQALASVAIIFPGLMLIKSSPIMDFASVNSLITSSLAVKMGMAPTHFWFPQVMELINWFQASLLLTWQKAAPMILLFPISESLALSIFIIFSCLIGPLGGFNLNSLKKIIAFSSIAHLAWMASSTLVNFKTWFSYFILYSILTISVVFIFWGLKLQNISLANYFTSNKNMSPALFINLLSLGGMPPLTGVFPKIMVISNLSLSSNPQIALMLFLIMSSVTTLFFYVKIIYSSMFVNNTNYFILSSLTLKTPIISTLLISSSVIGNFILFPLVLLI